MTPSLSRLAVGHFLAYSRFLFIEVHGGYFDGLRAVMAPHTTCLIGGKGSGKTTLFEMMRFVVAATSLTGKDKIRSLLKKNLGTGFVRAGIETEHGVRYIVERSLADDKPRYFTEDGVPLKHAPEGFLIEAYGQDEIEEVGETRASQLGLIDRLAGEPLRPYVAEIERVTASLRDGAKTLLALEAEIATLESSAGEARAIEEQLVPLLTGTGEDAARVATAHAARGLRGREKQTVVSAGAALADVQREAAAFAASTRKKLDALVAPDARGGANAALFVALEAQLAAVSALADELVRGVVARAHEASAFVTGLRDQLAVVHADQDVQYDALVARQKEDQARIDERTRLQERHAVVAGSVPLLDERMRLHAQLRRDQDALAARLTELRDLRTGVRKQVEQKHRDRLLEDGVRFRVKQDRQVDEYRAYLRDALAEMTNNQPKWLVDKIVPAFRPDELVATVRAQDAAKLTELAGLAKHPERAKQVIAALTSNAHLYALQAVAIDDEVIIDTKHGEVFKDTVECSPGQRSGAILPILLLEGRATLLVDQPDDNVDPDFMCNSILPRIAALRGARQFVFVTHQANVPILSGAELLLMIGSDGTHGSVTAHGDVDHMKGWIVTKLEGGEKAFETRRRTYAGGAPEVAPSLEAVTSPEGEEG